MLSAVKRSETTGQFLRYSVVGLIGFVIDFGIYNLLTRGFAFWAAHNIGANVVSFSCAVVNNFFWNRSWTFRPAAGADAAKAPQAQVHRQFLVFVFVSVVGLTLNSTILHAVSQVPHVQAVFHSNSDNFAKAVAVPIVWFWNFGANKLWTFRKH